MGEPSPSPSSSSPPADYFALLGQPRRPWIDPDALKARFLELSAGAHPDRVHGASPGEKEAANRSSAELNAAYQCLREPKDRLSHLLALEQGSRPSAIETVPEEAVELFVKVGQVCRAVDSFVASRPAATSPMLKVQRFKESLQWTDQVQALLGDLHERWAGEEARLRHLSAVWESGARPLAECEEAYRRLSYLSRWQSQIRERLTQLATE